MVKLLWELDLSFVGDLFVFFDADDMLHACLVEGTTCLFWIARSHKNELKHHFWCFKMVPDIPLAYKMSFSIFVFKYEQISLVS